MAIFHDMKMNPARERLLCRGGFAWGVKTNHRIKKEAAFVIGENKLRAGEFWQKVVSRPAWRGGRRIRRPVLALNTKEAS